MPGAVSCTPCAGRRSTLEPGASESYLCLCPSGLSDAGQWNFNVDCGPCPPGADCVQGALPRPRPGYWFDPASAGPASAIMVPCIPPQACRGGAVVANNVSLSCIVALHTGDAPRAGELCPPGITSERQAFRPAGAVLCTPGYAGERCSLCAPGFYRLASECRPCESSYTRAMLMGAGVAAMGATLAWIASRSRLSITPITIAVDFFQTVGRQATTRVPWPGGARTVLSWSGVLDFELELLAPECVADVSYTAKWYAVVLVPLGLLLLLAGVYLARGVALGVSRRLRPGRRRSSSSRRALVSNVLLLCQLLYMVLVVKALTALDCQELPDGSSVLEASADIACWSSSTHLLLAAGGVAALALYGAGIPLLFVGALRRTRREKDRRGFWHAATAPLAARFRDAYPWWILVIMLRKSLVAAVAMLHTSRPTLQQCLNMMVLGVALAVQFRFRPYRLMARGWRQSLQVRKSLGDPGQQTGLPPGVQTPLRERALEALTDGNVMEESALTAAFMVTSAGMMFLALEEARREQAPMPAAVSGLLDTCIVLLMSLSALWVVAATLASMVYVNSKAAASAGLLSQGNLRVRELNLTINPATASGAAREHAVPSPKVPAAASPGVV